MALTTSMRSPFVIIVSPAAWVMGALLGMLLVGISKTLIALVVLSIRTPMIGILVSISLAFAAMYHGHH